MKFKYDEALESAKYSNRIFIATSTRLSNEAMLEISCGCTIKLGNLVDGSFFLFLCGIGYREAIENVRQVGIKSLLSVDLNKKIYNAVVADSISITYCTLILSEPGPFALVYGQRTDLANEYSELVRNIKPDMSIKRYFTLLNHGG